MAAHKQHPYRPVTPKETIIGLIILIVLAIVAVLVIMEQYDYDPGIYRLDTSLLTDKPEQAPGTIPTLLKQLAEKLNLTAGAVESFTPDNVYEKIDGKDQAFLDLDMKSLDVVRLNHTDQTDQAFEVFVYDMAKPENAFGIFAAMRTDDPAWTYGDLVGQAAPNGVFFYKGSYYVSIIGASTDEPVVKTMHAVAESLADSLQGTVETFWAWKIFPEKDQVPDSKGYILKNWLGTDFFDQAFTARYKINGQEVTAYLSKRADHQNAEQLFDRLEKYFTDIEAKPVTTATQPNYEMTVVEMFGAYDVAFKYNHFIGGVSQAENKDLAVALAESLCRALIADNEENPKP